MELYDLFYKWVPVYVKLPVLFILILGILVCNGIFLGNTTDIFSDLGVYTEPYTQAYNAMYIGMGLGLIAHVRLKLRFTNKQLLLTGLFMMLLMNIICATTSNTILTITACLILGFVKIWALIEVYVIWLIIWSKKFDTRRLYPFVYFTALGGLYLMTWVNTELTYIYSWRYSYIIVFVLLLLCILLVLIFVEHHPLKRKVPFYQVDFIGIILLGSSMMLLDYAAVNGKVEDWWASNKIIAAFWGAGITFLLFLRRELIIKRPFFDFSIFKKAAFRSGLLYFVFLGIVLPGTFQSTFTAGILHYEAIRNTELNLYLVPGIFAGCILCYIWYYKEYDGEILILGGFSCFVIYHIMMYNSFANDFNINDFWVPLIIKGFGTALLYVAIGLYATRSFTIPVVLSAAGAMIVVRSFIGGGIISALYSYFLYDQRVKHLDYLAGKIDANNYLANANGAANLYRNMQVQATLAASKQLTGYIIIAGILILIIILTKYIFKKLHSRDNIPAVS
jgi:DHA2 family multidrug resistance protein